MIQVRQRAQADPWQVESCGEGLKRHIEMNMAGEIKDKLSLEKREIRIWMWPSWWWRCSGLLSTDSDAKWYFAELLSKIVILEWKIGDHWAEGKKKYVLLKSRDALIRMCWPSKKNMWDFGARLAFLGGWWEMLEERNKMVMSWFECICNVINKGWKINLQGKQLGLVVDSNLGAISSKKKILYIVGNVEASHRWIVRHKLSMGIGGSLSWCPS